ncbi:TPA: hypothetical protein ACGFAU_004506 [Yersinia enterocolitica]
MAIPPPITLRKKLTGAFKFEVGFLTGCPIMYVEVLSRVRRFAPFNDEVDRYGWEKATVDQAYEIQFLYNEPVNPRDGKPWTEYDSRLRRNQAGFRTPPPKE